MQPEYALTFLLKERHLQIKIYFIVLISNIYWLIGWILREPLKQIKIRCSRGYTLSITVLHIYSFDLISSKISLRPSHIQSIFSRHLTKVRAGNIRCLLSRQLGFVIYLLYKQTRQFQKNSVSTYLSEKNQNLLK